MEEKKYPTIEEEDGYGCMTAAEPVAGLEQTAYSKPQRHHNVPVGVPSTAEIAIAEIEEGEKQFERGETFSHREVMQMVWTKINNYAG